MMSVRVAAGTHMTLYFDFFEVFFFAAGFFFPATFFVPFFTVFFTVLADFFTADDTSVTSIPQQ
jgi:hypothetical protein